MIAVKQAKIPARAKKTEATAKPIENTPVEI